MFIFAFFVASLSRSFFVDIARNLMHRKFTKNSSTTKNYKDELFNAIITIYKILKNHTHEEKLLKKEPKKSFQENIFEGIPTSREETIINNFENDLKFFTFGVTQKLTDVAEMKIDGKDVYESNENAEDVYLNYAKKYQKKDNKDDVVLNYSSNQRTKGSMRENVKITITPRNNQLKRKKTKLLRNQKSNGEIDTKKLHKFADLVSANENRNHRMNKRKRQQIQRGSRTNLKKVRNHNSKSASFNKYQSRRNVSFVSHAINQIHHKEILLDNNSLNNNSSVAVIRNEDLVSENVFNKSTLTHSSVDNNITDITGTNTKSVIWMGNNFSNNKFEITLVPVERKERVVIENTGNSSAFSWTIFLKAVDFTSSSFNYTLSHTTVSGIIVSIIVIVIIIFIILVSFKSKTKHRKSQYENDYLLLKTNDSDNSMATKRRRSSRRCSCCGIFKLGHKQEKSRSYNSFNASDKFGNESNALYSIGSESEEDEKNSIVVNNSYNKKLAGSDNCVYHLQDIKKQNLQQKRIALKTPDDCHSKLRRLHKNFSTRTGNVCYTDALKKSEVKLASQAIEDFRKDSTKRDSSSSNSHEANIKNYKRLKKDEISKEFEKYLFSVGERDDDSLQIFSDNDLQDENFEEFDPSNPFYEG